MKRAGLLGGLLCAAVLIVPAGCVSPDEETWMQITGIGTTTTTSTTDEDGTTTTSTTFHSSSIVNSDLQSGTTDLSDVEVQNTTLILGGSGGGVSITVYHAKVEYFVEGQNLPSYEYAVILFLPAPAAGDVGSSSTTGVLVDLPLVPAALKNWILDPANIPAEIAARGFTGEARITLRGRTEEDKQIETSTGVTVVFN